MTQLIWLISIDESSDSSKKKKEGDYVLMLIDLIFMKPKIMHNWVLKTEFRSILPDKVDQWWL